MTISARPGDYFKGFFVQATGAQFQHNDPARPSYGTFIEGRNSQTRTCRAAVGQVGGITHTNDQQKSQVTFEWQPPYGCNLGNIKFVYVLCIKSYTAAISLQGLV